MTRDPVKKRARLDRENERKREKRRRDPEWARQQDKNRIARMHRGAEHVPPGQIVNETSLLTNEQTGDLTSSWTKTIKEPTNPPVEPPPNFLLQGLSTMLVAGETRVQWMRHSPEAVRQWEAMKQACREATDEYRGLVRPTPAPENVDERLLNIVPIGDPHLSMLAWAKETGEDFDSSICRDDLLRVLETIFDRSPAAKTCIIAQLGDLFHVEDDKNRTPLAGHVLDADSRSGKTNRIAYQMMRSAVDLGLAKHERVIVFNLRGNHDPHKSLGLNLYLERCYEDEPRVTVLENDDPFLFHEHGNCLFGFHHGDGARPQDLPGIMATWQGGGPWGRARHRKWFTGHIHTEMSRLFPGVFWQSVMNLAPNDFWAHHRGYRGLGMPEQYLECHTYDLEDGLVSRQPVTLRLARKVSA